MFYVKAKINDDVEIKVNIYGDDIYTNCLDCEKEFQVSEEELEVYLHEGLSSISACCKECSIKRNFARNNPDHE